MKKEYIATAETVIEAKEHACKELGVETHEAEIEILQLPEKKKFGIFGGTPAKVRAYIKEEDKDTENTEKEDEVKKTEKINITKEKKEVHNKENIKDESTENAEVTEIDIKKIEIAKKYLNDILNKLNINNLSIKHELLDGACKIIINGDNIGFIIGHRGETLDALQHITSVVANSNQHENYLRIVLDISNYRIKREETLKLLAQKKADKAKINNRKVSLEPMNAYERKIIHTEIQKTQGVISVSEGEGRRRHVVIKPEDNINSQNSKKEGENDMPSVKLYEKINDSTNKNEEE